MSLGRFAIHLGFPNPDAPLFDALVASRDPVDHIAFAAEMGFGGVTDPFAAMRSMAEQARIGDAAARWGLQMGSFLYAPFDKLRRARWASTDPEVRAMVIEDVRSAIEVANRLNSRLVAVVGLNEPDAPAEHQYAAMRDTLRTAGDVAAAAGIELCVEGVNPQRLPQMLLHGVERTAAVVRDTAHPAVKLLFDTGHAAAMDEDICTMLDKHELLIGTIQIADGLARTEMGGGTLHFGDFLARAERIGRPVVYELEHRWSAPGLSIQSDYLDRLRTVLQIQV